MKCFFIQRVPPVVVPRRTDIRVGGAPLHPWRGAAGATIVRPCGCPRVTRSRSRTRGSRIESMRNGREERGTGKHACACISTTSPAFRASAFRPVSSVRCCAWSLSFPARARATPPRVGLSVSLSSDAALSCLAWASPWDTHACYCGVCTELRRPSPMQVEGPAHWPTASFCSQQATCMAP